MSAANPLTELLRPHVAALKIAASNNDVLAKNVITLYQMYIDCQRDPGAPALCRAAFDQWIVERAAINPSC